MKLVKYISLFLFALLGLFNQVEAKVISVENQEIEIFSGQNFQEPTQEIQWLGLLHLQKEALHQNQILSFNFSIRSSNQNFSEELCLKGNSESFQLSFQLGKKSGSHQGNGGWNEIVFNENPTLVNAWKKIDNAGFDALRKNVDALEYVDNLKSATKFGDDGVESFSGIKGIWDRKFPETLNADGTSKLVRHHAVEQQVLTKYPDLITKKEMHSLDNLRGVPKEINSDLHLKQIRREWDNFYKKYPPGISPTKQQLLDKAKEIDDLFGDQFFPPVR